ALMPRSPPSLVPYTTLFRSSRSARRPRRTSSSAARPPRSPGTEAPSVGALGGPPHQASPGLMTAPRPFGIAGLTGAREQQRTEEDRKSTRLNSSHVKISYAV